MGKIIIWSVTKLVDMIVKILADKFDCFIVIEGNRGLGKSTLATHIVRRTARKFNQELGIKKYKFSWKNTFIYTQKDTIDFLQKWEHSAVLDEMVNVTFNRDFFSESQKDIVKLMNMNRDHRNLIVSCVPQFQTLDSQIKNLCRIRITVKRRGYAIIQTQNQSIYSKDKWDTAHNEKIEREWIKKHRKPSYAKLSTFRGVLNFPALSPQAEEKYQATKNEKRNIIENEKFAKEGEGKDEYDIALEKLMNNSIKNSAVLDGMALLKGVAPTSFKTILIRRLKKMGKPHKLSDYYWEGKPQSKILQKLPSIA